MEDENANPFDNDNPFANDANPFQNDGGDSFTINIKNVNGDSSLFNVSKTMTIGELVQKYRQDNAIKGNAKVILTYQGKILSDKNTIGSYEIDSDETLHALVRLQGGF